MFKQSVFMCRPCAEQLKEQGMVKMGTSVSGKQTCSNCGRRRFVYRVEKIADVLTDEQPVILPIKKKWFDMIINRTKPEEYREIKPYWTTRFKITDEAPIKTAKDMLVLFKNGYSANSPSCLCKVKLRIGTGKEKWGAEPNVQYYILEIIEIIETKFVN